MGEMSNEERNKIMDQFLTTCEKLKSWNEHQGEFVIYGRIEDQLPAIRECDRKARAWDELEKWTKERDWTSTGASYIRTFQLKMAELLSPPKPKSVYDKVRDMARHMTFNGTIVTNHFLKKIDRLEAEE